MTLLDGRPVGGLHRGLAPWVRYDDIPTQVVLAFLAAEEEARRHARRSLVAARRIPAGTRLEEADLTWKRPAHGIPPYELGNVVGRIAADDIEEDAVLTWPMLR